LLRQPPDHVAPSVMALLVCLITRRPCAFLVPLVDGAKRNIEQPRNLISGEAGFRLSAGLFAGLRHVFRGGCGGWAVWIRTGPQHRHIWIRTGPQHRHSSIVWVSGTAYALVDRATCVEKSEKRTALPTVQASWWARGMTMTSPGPISSSEPSFRSDVERPETTSIVIGLAGVHPLDQLEGLNTASRAQASPP